MDPFFYPVALAAIAAGASMGSLGVYLVGMRMPLAALAISHAAMVGAVLGPLAGLPWLPSALVTASLVSGALAFFRPELGRLDPTSGLAVVFSLLMGLIFLGMSLAGRTLSLPILWGNLLSVYGPTLWAIVGSGAAVAAFLFAFSKELKAVLFSRLAARAMGVHEGLVTGLFLALTGLVITVNVYAIGGLMIYSLVSIPAAASFQVARGHRGALALAAAIGAVSGLAGLGASVVFNAPTGASIVLASVGIFALAALYRKLRARRD